jgi:hypothetical protein
MSKKFITELMYYLMNFWILLPTDVFPRSILFKPTLLDYPVS